MHSLLSIDLFGHFSYVGLFLVLGGAGMFTPIPEELTLITAGYFAHKGVIDPLLAIPVSILAVLIGDSVLFFLAKTGAPYAQRLRSRKIAKRLEQTWVFSPTHPLRPIFFLRPFSGLRMLSPLYAGINDAHWVAFLLADLLALSIHIPLLFSIGYFLHPSLKNVVSGILFFQETGLIILLVIVMAGMAYPFVSTHFRKQKRHNNNNSKAIHSHDIKEITGSILKDR
jgi:membrane protein DedA with SNARE-associated domain